MPESSGTTLLEIWLSNFHVSEYPDLSIYTKRDCAVEKINYAWATQEKHFCVHLKSF